MQLQLSRRCSLAKGRGTYSCTLAEKVVVTSEVVRLRDLFGITRLKEGVYTPGQIDNKWSEEIEKDFSKWIRDHIDELPVPKDQIRELIKERMW